MKPKQTINVDPEKRPCGHYASGFCLVCGKQFCDKCEGFALGTQRRGHKLELCKRKPVP